MPNISLFCFLFASRKRQHTHYPPWYVQKPLRIAINRVTMSIEIFGRENLLMSGQEKSAGEETGLYEAQWKSDNLSVSCFVHEVMNFRYHWHVHDFELNILLSGEQYFCRGTEKLLLQKGDIVLVNPNEGHASYGQQNNTLALVIHFSDSVFAQFVPKKNTLFFPTCHSDAGSLNETRFRELRAAAARLILSLSSDDVYAQFSAKASAEMLVALLCQDFSPAVVSAVPDIDACTQQAMRTVMSYVEEHFEEKISLEDIADMTNHNRTYISTLFHKAVGISFYDYVMRVRMQNALKDLVLTDKKLTDIAMTNGFADLKSFNSRFRELLGCLPSEYRKNVLVTPAPGNYHGRKFIPCSDSFVREALLGFLQQ